MKKFLLLAIASILSLGASAQLISSNTTIHYKQKREKIKIYNRIGLSYDFLMPSDGYNGNGVSLDWTIGINVTKKHPIYIETGLRGTYGFDVSDNDIARLTVPINVAYKITTPKINIVPFLGPTLNINWKTKDRHNHYDSYTESSETHHFEDDYYDFTAGVHAGVNIEYKKFYAGIAYEHDVMHFKNVDEEVYQYRAGIHNHLYNNHKHIYQSMISMTVGFVF